jgi:hypothetical protein
MSNIKLKDTSNLIELADEIYLYKNFYDNGSIEKFTTVLDQFKENDWHQHGNLEIGDHEDTFWGDKCSLDIVDYAFHERIFNFFTPVYWMYQHKNFVRLKAGQKSIISEITDILSKITEYKIALYLGNFEGGTIVFPELDFKYNPIPNDLLIFKSDYRHYTEEVTSGTRYAYMDYLIKHPNYFMP